MMMWGAGWWFWMLLFWVAILVVVVWGIRQFAPRPHQRALEILAEQFARGELDPDEYRARRAELERG